MNETNEPGWIGRLFIGIGVIGLMGVIFFGMFAPAFGPIIERKKYQEYAIFEDCEQRVALDMIIIYAFLWIIAIISWIGFLAVAIALN
ncbi:MAG TPA: hypothetical protein PLC59_07675 [Bacteroidales bacterium]|jgi:uncharacterized BrkB/YihY/UPF0761 family membrane protein|nr:hypothetical protein [Bacteroidales bacterium]